MPAPFLERCRHRRFRGRSFNYAFLFQLQHKFGDFFLRLQLNLFPFGRRIGRPDDGFCVDGVVFPVCKGDFLRKVFADRRHDRNILSWVLDFEYGFYNTPPYCLKETFTFREMREKTLFYYKPIHEPCQRRDSMRTADPPGGMIYAKAPACFRHAGARSFGA